jgi:hypothetical protein
VSTAQPALFSDPAHEIKMARRMRGEKALIKVAHTPQGGVLPVYREREARVYGPLALHERVVFDEWEGQARHDGWTITHVGIGYAAVPEVRKRDEALRLIWLLRDEDWRFDNPSRMPPSVRERLLALSPDGDG